MSRRTRAQPHPLSQSQRHNMSVDDIQDAVRYRQCLVKLSKVMDVVQSDEYVMGGKKGKICEKLRDKVMKQVEKIFQDSGLKVFSETLMRMMVVPFQAKDSNPYVSRLIDFFFDLIRDGRWIDEDFSNSPDMNTTVNSTNSSILEDGSEPLPIRILKLCERYHNEGRAIVRQRFMQTVERIIPDVIEAEKLGRPLQTKLIRMLVMRRKDKNDQVRALALRNLCQFYKQGFPFYGQVEDALLHHMSYDPVPSARLQVVSNIPINDNILEVIVERTGDPNDAVRAAALDRLAKDVPLTKLPLQLRENILKANTSEDNPKIIEKALNGLLKEWLSCFENNPCEFLRILDVRRRRKLCRSALDTVYCDSSEVAYEKMSTPLLNGKTYPEESLCVESTFLWLYIYTRFQEEPYIMKKLAIPVGEMIEYINEFVDVVEDEGNLTEQDLSYRSWMLGDMLQILAFLPVEEGERQAILRFLPELFVKKKLMDTRNSCLGVKLISVCSNIQDETHVIDLVNTVIDSDRVSTRKSKSYCKTPLTMKPESDENDFDSLENLRREHGHLIHRSRKLEKERDAAAAENDLLKAQECQDEIRKLEAVIDQKKVQILELEQEHNQTNNSISEETETDEPWPYTDSTMLITLSLVKENIEYLNKVSDFSRTFYEMYALKALMKCKRDTRVRALAIELICLVALEYETESSQAAAYCLTALLGDVLLVKVSALKGLYDLALKYSFAQLGAKEHVQRVLFGFKSHPAVVKLRVDPEDPATTLKTLLLTYIRNQEISLVKVSVAGVLKLLFKREINFSRIITSFLTHWAIPSHETRLRFKDVGVMVPVYATMGENEAIEVSSCLLHCIKKTLTKMHSGQSSNDEDQLPYPDLDHIVSLIVKATHPTKLASFQRPYIGHQTIALGALSELQDVDLVTDEKLQYAKLLKVLELKDCPPDTVRQMLHSVTEIAETNRRIGTILGGFSRHLESFIADSGDTADRDEQNANVDNGGDDDDVPASAFGNEEDVTMISDSE